MELLDYISPLRRWWWLILVAGLLGAGSSYIATSQQPPLYQSSATLQIGRAIEDPNPNSSEFFLTQQLAATYVDLAKRGPVREGAQEELGIGTLPDYFVAAVPNTQLISLTVIDTTPERAQAVADALANQLVLISPTGLSQEEQESQTFISEQLDDLQSGIKETESEIRDKQEELNNLFSASEIDAARNEINALQNKLNVLRSTYASLLANTQSGATNSIRIVEPAYFSPAPVGSSTRRTTLMAGLIGILLASVAAYALEYLDDTIKNPDQVRRRLGLQTLGAVPVIPEATEDHQLVVYPTSESISAEAYRILRTNFRVTEVDKLPYVLLVSSALAAEGKTQTSANLAASLAQAGNQVILIDADLHRPDLHRLFGATRFNGLTTALLADDLDLVSVLQETMVPGLRLLTSGPLPPNPAELLSTRRMAQLIDELRGEADIIVIDSPPITAVADTAVLTTLADGVLLVVDSSRTQGVQVERALDALRQVRATILGIVLNRMPAGKSDSYYYYYQYRGGYYGQEGEGEGEDTPLHLNGNGKKAAADTAPYKPLR